MRLPRRRRLPEGAGRQRRMDRRLEADHRKDAGSQAPAGLPERVGFQAEDSRVAAGAVVAADAAR